MVTVTRNGIWKKILLENHLGSVEVSADAVLLIVILEIDQTKWGQISGSVMLNWITVY